MSNLDSNLNSSLILSSNPNPNISPRKELKNINQTNQKNVNVSPLKPSKLSSQQFYRRNLIHGGDSTSGSGSGSVSGSGSRIEAGESSMNRMLGEGSSKPSSTSNPSTSTHQSNPSYEAEKDHDISVNSTSTPSPNIEPSRSSLSLSLHDLDPDRTNSEDLDLLEDSVRGSETIDDFTRIIQDFRLERRRRNRMSLMRGEDGIGGEEDDVDNQSHFSNRNSIYSNKSGGTGNGSEGGLEDSFVSNRSSFNHHLSSKSGGNKGKRRSMDENSLNTIASNPRESGFIRCTCCCDRDHCERKERAIREWRDMELDLRLAAEIGQTLLRRHDTLSEEHSNAIKSHSHQRDSLMSKLTHSIKESSNREKLLIQTNLNLEAADSSNRNLLNELNLVRNQLKKSQIKEAKNLGLENELKESEKREKDLGSELKNLEKEFKDLESKLKKSKSRNDQLNQSLKELKEEKTGLGDGVGWKVDEETIREARERLKLGLEAGSSDVSTDSKELLSMLSSLMAENSSLKGEKMELKTLLDSSNDELTTLREASTSILPSSSGTPSSRSNNRSRKSSLAGLGFDENYKVPKNDEEKEVDENEDLGDRTMDTQELDVVGTPSLSEEIVVLATNQGQDSNDSNNSSSFTSRSNLKNSELFRSSNLSNSSSKRSLSPSRSFSIKEGNLTPSESVASSIGTNNSLLSPPTTQTSLRPKMTRRTSSSTGSTSTTLGEEGVTSARGGKGSVTSTTPTSTMESEQETSSSNNRQQKEKENRTSQLSNLLDSINRIFSRLSSSDVDTLTRRLQRQHLTGDVGHLARTTVNGIVRDVEGLRDHFRKLIEQDARALNNQNKEKDDNSSIGSSNNNQNLRDDSSLVNRRDFFSLIKVFREMFVEMAKLRSTINEIQMNPNQASKILQDQLGVIGSGEDKGILPVGGWIARMFTNQPSGNGGTGTGNNQPGSVYSQPSAPTTGAISGLQNSLQGKGLPSPNPNPISNPGHGHTRAASRGDNTSNNVSRAVSAPRANAEVVSSDLEIEVKGNTHASALNRRPSSSSGLAGSEEGSASPLSSSPISSAPDGGSLKSGPRPQINRARSSLTRTQSKNLSGLFVGSVNTYNSSSWDAFEKASAGGRMGNGSGNNQRPLSRIVDDDEISIHQGRRGYHSKNFIPNEDDSSFPNALNNRGGFNSHRRNLSDSSIHSTFLEDGLDSRGNSNQNNVYSGNNVGGRNPGNYLINRPSPISRIITPSTLSLQVSGGNDSKTTSQTSLSNNITANRNNVSPSPSEDSNSTTGTNSNSNSGSGSTSRMRSLLGGNFGIPSLRPVTSSATLSLSNASTATGASSQNNRRAVSSGQVNSNKSNPLPISPPKEGRNKVSEDDLNGNLAFGRMGRSNAF